jgi:desulfoferrodoxin (superoxide reductase-like protein)
MRCISLFALLLLVQAEDWKETVTRIESSIDPTATAGAESLHFQRDQTKPEKHAPFMTFRTGSLATIRVRGADGSRDKLHPMSEEHWISALYAKGISLAPHSSLHHTTALAARELILDLLPHPHLQITLEKSSTTRS